MKRAGQTRIEWALLAVIAVVCAVLSFFQYRWTGDLSKAEPALLRAGLNDQLRRLSQEFDNDLRESCTALLPDEQEIRGAGAAETLRNRYAQWVSSHDKNLFLRMGMATPERGDLTLHGIDGTGNVAPMAWPQDWEYLRTAMTARLQGSGRPPSTRPDSSLIDMPIFAAAGPELGWMIFELNEEYVRGRMLPQLVAEYLNPIDPVYDVSISRGGLEGQVIFATRSDHPNISTRADAEAGLFPFQVGGPAVGRGRGRFREDSGPSR